MYYYVTPRAPIGPWELVKRTTVAYEGTTSVLSARVVM